MTGFISHYARFLASSLGNDVRKDPRAHRRDQPGTNPLPGFTLAVRITAAATREEMHKVLTRANHEARKAVAEGDVPALERAFGNGARINHRDRRTGNTLLSLAIQDKTPGTSRQLVDTLLGKTDRGGHHSNPLLQNRRGQDSFHAAALASNHYAMDRMLGALQLGGTPEQVSFQKATLLEQRDRSGHTAAFLARARPTSDMAEVLARHGIWRRTDTNAGQQHAAMPAPGPSHPHQQAEPQPEQRFMTHVYLVPHRVHELPGTENWSTEQHF